MTIKPMLAQPSDPARLIQLTEDDNICFEQKLDGHRIMVHVENNVVSVLNRNGDTSSATLPPEVRSNFAALDGDWVFDGELMADKSYWIFDIPLASLLKVDPSKPLSERHVLLRSMSELWERDERIKFLPTAYSQENKVALARKVMRNNGEGLIAKDLNSRYASGRRSPAWQKLKFCRDIDCVVTDLSRNGKANIGLGVYRDDKLYDVGEVTAMAGDGAKIQVGDVVTVKFLYAVDPARPRLVQPTLPRLRDDKKPEECTIKQLDDAYRNLDVLTDWQ